jgi:PAS domain S-box-containing protein
MLSASTLDSMVEDIRRSFDIAHEERKWKLMISEVKLIVVELNTLGQVKYANPYLLQVSGYKEDEVIGKDWFELLLPSSHAYEVQSAFIEILTNDFHPVYNNPIITKSGEELLVSWYNVRLRDEKGKISGSISIGVDISEFRDEKENIERSLLEARELIEKLQKKT